MSQTYSFVTIVFAGEIELHRLQAQSLARYLAPDVVAAIIVIENSPMPAEWRSAILPEYGDLAARVTILSALEIATVPDVGGWYSQQVLKLLISRHLTTERYVLLDAKNHLVFPLQRDHLERDGKMLSFRHDYHDHPLRPFLERTGDYYAIRIDLSQFPPTTTPFVLPVREVRQMLDHIEQTEGDFVKFFLSKRFCEFFLVVGYLIVHNRLDALYDFSGINYATIWQRCAHNDAWIKTQIDKTEHHRQPFFAVHRRALPDLTPIGCQMLAEFWHRHTVFASVVEAISWLDNLRK